MCGRRLRNNLLEKVKDLGADVKPQNGLFEPEASCPFCGFVFNQLPDPLFFSQIMERSLKHMPVISKKYFSTLSPSAFGSYFHWYSIRQTRSYSTSDGAAYVLAASS